MVTGLENLNAASYSSFYPGGINGKVYVPVQPKQAIYAHFEHVSGVPAQGGSGVSVSKIKILNTLIDQLIKYKKDTPKPELPTDLSDSQIDALIKDYQEKITTALNTAKANPFGMTGGAAPETGLVVSVAA